MHLRSLPEKEVKGEYFIQSLNLGGIIP